MITAVFFLIIPAFSFAISSNEFPNKLVWSYPILVIIDISGLIILVLSNRPPKPVSIIAISTFSSVSYTHLRAHET